MADERTAEQIAADDNLMAVIEQVSRAYGHLEEGWAVGDFVVGVEYTGFSDETTGKERYAYMMPREFTSTHRLIGLLDYTKHLVINSEEA